MNQNAFFAYAEIHEIAGGRLVCKSSQVFYPEGEFETKDKISNLYRMIIAYFKGQYPAFAEGVHIVTIVNFNRLIN